MAQVIIFVLALLIRVWFNFFTQHINVAFSWDGWEYLMNAQAIQNVLHLPFSDWNRETLQPLKGLLISGPIFPLFVLGSFVSLGQVVSPANWFAPVFIQSLFSAFACVLIALIGKNCWNEKTGLVAGLLAAIYPGFIISTARVCSESFACFLVCLILWLVTRSFTGSPLKALNAFLLGLLGFILQATRSAMIVLSFCLIPIIAFANWKQAARNVTFFILGFLMLALPWLVLQKLAFGSASLVVDRCSRLNLVIGNNVNTLGWQSFPYPDVVGIETESVGQLIGQSIKGNPGKWLQLMMDKPVRLFKMPYNDMRVSIGPLSFYDQVIVHQIILLLAMLGLSFALFGNKKDPIERKKTMARLVILLSFFIHFAYIPFIALARYALSAIPAVILFAASGSVTFLELTNTLDKKHWLFKLLLASAGFFVIIRSNFVQMFTPKIASMAVKGTAIFFAPGATLWLIVDCLIKLTATIILLFVCLKIQKKLSRNSLAAVITTVLLFLAIMPAVCLPLRAHGRWYEWEESFDSAGQKIEQNISLNSNQLQALKTRQAYILLNLASGDDLANELQITVNGINIDGPYVPAMPFAQDLTRLQKLPNGKIKYEGESVLNDMAIPAGISILNLRQSYLVPLTKEELEQALSCPSSDLKISVIKKKNSPNTIFGAYSLNNKSAYLPGLDLYSWEKAFFGVEKEVGFNDPACDLKVPQFRTYNENYYLHLLLAPTVAKQSDKNVIWLMRISGELPNTFKEDLQLNAVATLVKEEGGSYLSYSTPWVPRKIITGEKFDYCFPIRPAVFPGQIDSVCLDWQDQSKVSKTLKIKMNQATSEGNCQLRIYQIAGSPIGKGYEIY